MWRAIVRIICTDCFQYFLEFLAYSLMFLFGLQAPHILTLFTHTIFLLTFRVIFTNSWLLAFGECWGTRSVAEAFGTADLF